ncbi:Hypothetical predicted protein [Podarcis lilfordi]|nr:Hypothetical predicted protein [Podarcis lilfordi]
MRWFTKLGAKGVAGTGSHWEPKEERRKRASERNRLASPAITFGTKTAVRNLARPDSLCPT